MSLRPSGCTPAFGRVEAAARRAFDTWAKAQAYLKSNGNGESNNQDKNRQRRNAGVSPLRNGR
jgi:hypothetical protein